MAISTDDEPRLSEALKSAELAFWLHAIKEKFKTLIDLKIWTEEKYVPVGVKVIPSGINLKLKRDANDRSARFNARLVVHGNFQTDDFNYAELYAPVACIDAVQILLAISVSKDWSTDHLENKGAFLYALLPESDEVWLKIPTIWGVFEASDYVVKLRNSLYGLRQAP